MSYSHISLGLGAVVLILVGGFIAIILIDLLFDVFDDIKAKWTARQQAGCQHEQIPNETARELARLAARHQQYTADARTARGLGVAGVVRPTRLPDDTTSRPGQGCVDAPTGYWSPPVRQARLAGNRTTSHEKPVVDKPQPASASRGPGRGDPPQGVN